MSNHAAKKVMKSQDVAFVLGKCALRRNVHAILHRKIQSAGPHQALKSGFDIRSCDTRRRACSLLVINVSSPYIANPLDLDLKRQLLSVVPRHYHELANASYCVK